MFLPRKLLKLLLVLILILLPLVYITSARADELSDLQAQIDDYNKQLALSKAATAPLEGQLSSLNIQLAQIQTKLNTLSANITQKEEDLKVREDKLALQQTLLNTRVRSYYIRSYLTSPLTVILSTQNSGDLFRDLGYQQTVTGEDQKVISQVTSDMIDLLQQKDKLEKDKISLASLQGQVDQNATFLGGEIKKAKDFQADLSSKIADLTAKQQAILAAKSGNFTTSVGDVPLADDPASRPDYNPGFSPAFAPFSFGAYSHRNGMSQYGAKGRAEAGQNAETILSHYYPGSSLNKSHSEPGSITVNGYGSMSFEDAYLIGIYEMPASFPQEALRAQAVAARTYAIRYTNSGSSSICADEGCQVFHQAGGRNDAWVQAVHDTRGWVLDGGPSAQYSSTTGGYTNTSGWDTTSGDQSSWTSGAYEKMAGSPWFYKGWYRQSYSNSSDTCGRSSPWLTEEEMSDILNAYLVQNKGGVDNGRITPVTTSCWSGNPYSMSELRDLANNVAGGAVTSISSVSVSYSTGGSTSTISFSTNRGTVSISGSDFKTIFNLRAPGYVSIKSPLFNIEKK